MKILLTAVNAKFIHSNPAIYSLRAYVDKKFKPYIELAEYTINNKVEEILADIYSREPDVIAFSCYIWNIGMITALITELPKVLPDTDIWLGGPEVSYDADAFLKKYPMLRGIMIGEGEEAFRDIVEYYCGGLGDAAGQTGADGELGRIILREPMDISKLPFLYDDLSSFSNRIIYYESSRGCPYRCSYCLSSIDKSVRFRDISIVKRELKFFLDNKVKQVKFVDRTFNCDKERALKIWEFLSKNDNGVTNFHFEIAAELITEEELDVLGKMRPGLVQTEIGVQSVNPDTLKEIRRISDIEKLRKTVKKLVKNRNIHIHLDLIAGLPYEDYESFIHSFNTVYAMQPDELQLGFLKVLKGSYMYEKAEDYELRYMDMPPYEVLSTKWLSYDNILSLKSVEEMLGIYYNSGQFKYTIPVLQTAFNDAFSMYKGLADFYKSKGYLLMTPSRNYRYQALLDYAMNTELAAEAEMFKQLLTFDLYLRENIKSRPDFAPDLTKYKPRIREFYEKEERERFYLPDYVDYDSRQLAKMTHMEIFDYPVWEEDVNLRMKRLNTPCKVLFDYRERDPITYAAKYIVVRETGEGGGSSNDEKY